MFSSRFGHDLTPNRLMEALAAFKAAGKEVIDLTESNPTRAEFSYDTREILDALANPSGLIYRPDPRGLSEARKAVCDYYESRALVVDPDSLFLTASTSEAYAYLFKLLGDPGDEILVPQPGYPLFELLASLECLRPVSYPLIHDDHCGWQIDLETLGNSVSTRTSAVVAIHPNNPTGSYLKQEELEAINRFCSDFGLALIVDEVFFDYARDEGGYPVARVVNNRQALTFILNGFSKILGLPQMKLGWIQVSGPEHLRRKALERLEFIADTFLSVSTAVQHAAGRLLGLREKFQRQVKDRILANESFLRKETERSANCRVLHREGGWYAILEIEDGLPDEERVVQLLERDRVLVHPGFFYGFPEEGYLVLSLIAPVRIFRAGVEKILQHAAGTRT